MAHTILNESLFAPAQVTVERQADGVTYVCSPLAPAPAVRCLGHYLEHWAAATPDAPFLMEREHAHWRGVSYAEALDQVRRIAAWLQQQGIAAHSAERPVMVLAENSVEHALLMLACLHIGVPYSALSTSYALVSKDFSKLRTLVQRLDPALIYVGNTQQFAPALHAIQGLHTARFVVPAGQDGHALPAPSVSFSALLSDLDAAALGEVEAAYRKVGPHTVAKILFTSGSTSEPKGVINTQAMLCSNQASKAQLWPFLQRTPPVLLDWLPWNHTFGGNHNFNMILANGGTLYIDAGKPVPGAFDTSLANLRAVAPTMYLNVPRGFDMLVPQLRSDAALRRQFFSRLQVIFYAAAALPQYLWDALMELSQQELGHVVPMVTGWGSTETSPLATDCNFHSQRCGVIGLPIPGVTLKLVPNGHKLEVRVKGPNVTPGYYKQPELAAKAFDQEGFYLIGDAVRFVDESRPELGLLFDGRVTEDFKLMTGTWVSAGTVRLKALQFLAPLAQDVVVAGHDRNDVRLLVFPNVAACRQISGATSDAPLSAVLAHPAVHAHIRTGLNELRKQGGGSSTFATCAYLMSEPPAVDAGEITDKGYINQGAVLRHRAGLVEHLYRADPADDVIFL